MTVYKVSGDSAAFSLIKCNVGLETSVPWFKSIINDCQSFGVRWQSPSCSKAEGGRPLGDFGSLDLVDCIPMVSPKVLQMPDVAAFLEPVGELLPVTVEGAPALALNVLRTLDVCDMDKSRLESWGVSRVVAKEPVFKGWVLQEMNGLFRIKEAPHSLFLAEPSDGSGFRALYKRLGLTGLRFEEQKVADEASVVSMALADLLITFYEPQVRAALSHWEWLLDEVPEQVVAVTALGDVFYRVEERVYFLNTSGIPTGFEMFENITQFEEQNVTSDFCRGFLAPPFVNAVGALLGPKPPGQCFSCANGNVEPWKDAPENYVIADPGEHVTVMGILGHVKNSLTERDGWDSRTLQSERRRFAKVLRQAYTKILGSQTSRPTF